jgi:DNA-binding transcriptional ArsR family regulator
MTLRDSGDPSPAADPQVPDEEEFASAASHPIAARALEMMTRRPTTAREVAKALDQPLEAVVSHLDDLRRGGLIVAAGAREVDGHSEPLYEGPFVPFLDKEELAELDPTERRFQLTQIIRLLMGDLEVALNEETLDAWPDFHLCRMPFHMDERGWREVGEVYEDALLKAIRIREEATERLQRDGEEGKRGTVAQALFELPSAE